MNVLEYLNKRGVRELHIANNFFTRLRGLIGRNASSYGYNKALLLTPCKSVHTFFMKQPIDIIFISSRGEVLKVKEHVYPRRLNIKHKGACGIIELFVKT